MTGERSDRLRDQIFDTLAAGGFQFDAKSDDNAKRILRISLSKNTNTFHKLPNGTYGLTEWYDGLKTPRSVKKSVAPEGEEADEVDRAEEFGAPVDEAIERLRLTELKQSKG